MSDIDFVNMGRKSSELTSDICKIGQTGERY